VERSKKLKENRTIRALYFRPLSQPRRAMRLRAKGNDYLILGGKAYLAAGERR
jgi:hypothetical protein